MTNTRRILDRRNVPFTMVTSEVLHDTSLKAADKAVYSILCLYADNRTAEAWPSRNTIMVKAGVSDKTLRNSLRVLSDKGYIDVKERRRSDGGCASNMYVLLDVK